MQVAWAFLIRTALLAAPLWGCSASLPAPCRPAHEAEGNEVAWLVDEGWHTEIGLPAAQLSGPLSVFRSIFPGAKVLLFGFGKRTWITARVETLSELLLGPLPGPGAIEVIGLRVSPDRAYRGSVVIHLAIGEAQAGRLAAFIWQSIGKTADAAPRLISPGLFPGSLFYGATDRYGLYQNCNSWSARAMQAAGLPVAPAGVVLPAELLDQMARLDAACLMPR